MSNLQCTSQTIKNGTWTGELNGADEEPKIEVRHLDQVVPDVLVVQEEDAWHVHVPIPAEAISDGVQTFSVFNLENDAVIADFTLIAGEPLGNDIRAEVELLRAELDMLKRAFRRHCVDTA